MQKRLAVVFLIGIVFADSASAIRLRFKKPRITVGAVKVHVGSNPLGGAVDAGAKVLFGPAKAGEKILNAGGQVVKEITTAGERLVETRLYAAGSVADCLQIPAKCIKDRPLEIAATGLMINVKDAEPVVDLGYKAVASTGVTPYVEKNFGKSLMWIGDRIAEVPNTIEPVVNAPAALEKWGLESAVQPFAETLRVVGNATGGDLERNLDKLAGFAQGDLTRYASYITPAAQNRIFAEKIGRPLLEISGKTLHYLGYYLAVSASGFPQAEMNRITAIDPVAGSVTVSGGYLLKILQALDNSKISLGKSRDDAISASRFSLSLRPDLNSIFVHLHDAQIGKTLHQDLGIKTSQHVRHAIVQIMPGMDAIPAKPEASADKKTDFMATMRMKLLFVDVEGMPQRLDQALAYVINDVAFSNAPTFDVTELVTLHAELDDDMDRQPDRDIALPTRAVSLRVSPETLALQIGL